VVGKDLLAGLEVMWIIPDILLPAVACLSLRAGLFPASCELHFTGNFIEFTSDIGWREAVLLDISIIGEF
jgi:hypothetical protein